MSSIMKSNRTECIKRCLNESFCLMDSDGDGYLDYYEMKAALKALGFTAKKSYVLSVIRMYDRHGCNRISFEDFSYVVSEKLNKRNPLDEIKHVFKLFINDSINNKITLEDLQKFNKKLNCNLTNEEMEMMVKEFDLNEDNSIDQKEFIDIMQDFTV